MDSSSCGEIVDRFWKLTSFSIVCRMRSAETCWIASAMCGSTCGSEASRGAGPRAIACARHSGRKTPARGQKSPLTQDVWKRNRNWRTQPSQNFLGKPLDLYLTKKLNITGYPECGGNHGVLSRMRDGPRHR